MFKYLIFEILSALAGIIAIIFILRYLWQKKHFHNAIKQRWLYIPLALFVAAFFTGLVANKTFPPDFAMPAFSHSHAPGGLSPAIPFSNIINFFRDSNRFEKVSDIGADPNAVSSEAQKPDDDGIVRLNLHTKEVISEISPGVYFNYWTFNKQVPGPLFRVKEGDTVEVTITNDSSSLHDHNVDLHAVNGPGGGAEVTHVSPGETKTFRFKALNPGVYVYHCAMPNVSTHNSHGQYGLIIVDPKDSSLAFPKVDKEFYLMQGELYTQGDLGKKGMVAFDANKLLSGNPTYVTFNGKIETVPRMHAKVGDKIRIFVGNGGVNLISSFHVIGEVFDTVYPEANIGGTIEHNVQTTAVLPGGASIVEFKIDVPGKYLIVDHALARMNKGAWAVLEVTGEKNLEIYSQVETNLTNHPVENHHMDQ